MAYEHREGSGSLFKNSRKQKNTHPDYQGECLINGQLYQIGGWIKEGKAGAWVSLSIQPKRLGSNVPTGGKNDPRPATQQGPIENEDFNDKIPW